MQNRTFRLFVSSTFSDFNEERKILQTKVFPEIKKYCITNKLNFQAIDLRWGVSAEAQLDQKTLELCLHEVQSSKINPHPNFLIMAGDRYGWIPLPYLIEEKEFDTILENIENSDDKKLLNSWYKLDENQIPSSYILNERKGEYVEYKPWEEIETKLRDILQKAVSNSNLNEENKKKYFTSATESEVIEGIFKYLEKTPFQKELLKKDNTLENKDYENVYAYIRNIKSFDDETLKDKFDDENVKDLKSFKENLRSSIKEENKLEVNVNLTNVSQDEKNSSLNYKYETIKDEESIFEKTMIEYLKSSIDKYVKTIKDITLEELEKLEQIRFKDDKLKDFLPNSRTKALGKIDDYISSNENQSLVVYGKSGLGKSSLMAKAIQETETKYKDKKVIYRFVGSMANLSNTPNLLISILKELGIEEEIKTIINLQTGENELEKIEEFYLRIKRHLSSIKIETLIFIDAIDQLLNEDEFLWLPQILPNNLKIIISALDDEKYPEDTVYFKTLKTKTTNLYSLEEFEENDAKEFIKNILRKYDRTITQIQMEYLLNIYKDIKTPLYLSVAAQELRHWKSDDNTQTLASSQKEIIKEFIENLTKLYHHDEEFVKRVFSYLYLSDGLSESELLEILSSDEEFLFKMAPDTYHKNESNELPVVIWARLHSQIKEFLKLENKNNTETISFFHREFNDVIKNQEDTKEIHEKLVILLRRLIVKYQYEEFDSNRWGKLYIEVIRKYHLKYEFDFSDSNIMDVSPIIEFFEEQFDDLLPFADYSFLFQSNDILCKEILNDNYLDKFVVYTTRLSKGNRNNLALFYMKNSHYISKKLSKNSDNWMQTYIITLHNLSCVLKYIGKENDSLNLEIGTSHLLLSLYIKYKKEQKNMNWVTEYFLMNSNNRANSLYKLGKVSEAIEIQKILLKLLETSEENDPILNYKYVVFINNISNYLYKNGQIDESIDNINRILNLSKILHKKDQINYSALYALVLSNLASFLYSNEKNKSLKYFIKSFFITKTFYNKDKKNWIDVYSKRINNIINVCKNLNKKSEAIKYQKKYLKELNIVYDRSEKIWVKKYIKGLNDLSISYISVDISESIKLENEALNILKSRQYEKSSKEWYQNYKMILNNLIRILKYNAEFFKAEEFEKELLKLEEEFKRVI